jgi:protein TonB
MRGDLFNDVVDPSVRVGPHAWYSVPLSIITHGVLVGALLVVPFVGRQVLPTPQTVLAFATPPATPVPPAPVIDVAPVPASLVNELPTLDAAPLAPPDGIPEEPPALAVAARQPGPPTTVRPGPDISLLPPETTTLATPPTVTPVESSPPRVGGAIEEPRKIHHVAPLYPAFARAARREGTVILEATIAKDGRVIDARVLRSSDVFDQAAIDAVRQWRYTVPTLNGVPVDVLMTVTVRFMLN